MTWATQPRAEGAGELAYWRAGAGPPLVLIHGVGLRAEAWGALVPLLSKHYSVFAVDLPGHGQSPLGHVGTLADYTARLAAFCEPLKGPIAIAGHSMGAMIALNLAGHAPDNVACVAALNAIYRRAPEAAAAVKTRAAELKSFTAPNPTATLQRWFGAAPVGSSAAAAGACRRWLTEGTSDGYAAAYAIFAEHDGPSDATLRNLAASTLFQTGGLDPNSTPDMARAMAALAPRGRANIVDGAAHMMPMTHPSKVASALLCTFQNTEGVA